MKNSAKARFRLSSTWFPIVFSTVLGLVAAVSFGLAILVLVDAFQHRDWKSTRATVPEPSEVSDSEFAREFRHEVGGITYEGREDLSGGFPRSVAQALEKTPLAHGERLKAIYDPGEAGVVQLRPLPPGAGVVFPALLASVFGFVAFLIGGICFPPRRSVSFEAGLVEEHPDKPWVWRQDWAERRSFPVATRLVGGIAWAGGSAALIFGAATLLAARSGDSEHTVLKWCFAVFFGLGVCGVFLAWKRLRVQKFLGNLTLSWPQEFISTGKMNQFILDGLPVGTQPRLEIRAKFSTGSGKTLQVRTLFQKDMARIGGDSGSEPWFEVGIPGFLHLMAGGSTQVTWVVNLYRGGRRSKSPEAVFEIPVFHKREPEEPLPDEPGAEEFERRMEEKGVLIARLPGSVSILSGSGEHRNGKWVAWLLAGVLGLLSAVCLSVPSARIAGWVLLVPALILAYVGLRLALRQRELVLRKEDVTLRTVLPWGSKSRSFGSPQTVTFDFVEYDGSPQDIRFGVRAGSEQTKATVAVAGGLSWCEAYNVSRLLGREAGKVSAMDPV